MRKRFLFSLIFIVLIPAGCKRNIPDQEIKITKNEISDPNEPNIVSKYEDSGLRIINAKEVKQHIGDSLIIKGYVADVYLSDKVAYLNFENKFPRNAFSCVIFPGNFWEFGDLSKFKGRNVEVTGKISTYRNKPQIVINSKDQIKILQ